jgi:hypothetical protein
MKVMRGTMKAKRGARQIISAAKRNFVGSGRGMVFAMGGALGTLRK